MTLKKFLDLGMQPLANGFSDYPADENTYKYHLEIGFDEETKLVSALSVPDKSMLFTDAYPYRAGMSKTFRLHLAELGRFVARHTGPILEIGSNDGTLAKAIKNQGREVHCVEPCLNFARELIDAGFTVTSEFFNNGIVDSLPSTTYPTIVATNLLVPFF